MNKHTKVYLTTFGLSEGDRIPCEVCAKDAVDIHHLTNRGMGGSKLLDTPENLVALCRVHHEECHKNKFFNEQVRKLHLTILSIKK